jgi:hypothetical protein
MSDLSERPRDMRRQGGDNFDFNREPRPAPKQPAPGRKLAPLDTGAVALAISAGMMYWVMPMLAGRRRRAAVRRSPNGRQ